MNKMDVRSYTKDLLKELGDKGYKIIPCTQDEQEGIFSTVRASGRCSRAGWIRNKEGEKIFFVLVKDRGVKNATV